MPLGKLTQSAIMERGWTKSMIDKLLPAPERVKNPTYGGFYKLWPLEQVEAAEKTEAFSAAKAKADKRRASAKKTVQHQKERLHDELTRFAQSAKIEVLPRETLERLAIEHQEDRRAARGNYAPIDYNISDKTIDRWVVNYIRHQLVDYDQALWSARGKAGIASEYATFKRAILAKIAKVYPSYAAECRRQIENL